MSREIFEVRHFQTKSLVLIRRANAIIDEYQAQGFKLTLRQLFYQFVAREVIANTQHEYKRLGDVIKNGRRSGLIDWDAIEDRTRSVRKHSSWDSPADIISVVAQQYREDLWSAQLYRPEVWIEKDALIGVIERVCTEYRVPFFACRGNNSESEQYKAGKRFAEYFTAGLTPIVLHLGDHDPNGIDMTRDNRDRLAIFARHPVEVRRLALNMDQIERFRPPPNFAKETDSRYAAYIQRFGPNCWELDALDPSVIDELIRTELEGLIDAAVWHEGEAQELANRARLNAASENWAKVETFLGGEHKWLP